MNVIHFQYPKVVKVNPTVMCISSKWMLQWVQWKYILNMIEPILQGDTKS